MMSRLPKYLRGMPLSTFLSSHFLNWCWFDWVQHLFVAITHKVPEFGAHSLTGVYRCNTKMFQIRNGTAIIELGHARDKSAKKVVSSYRFINSIYFVHLHACVGTHRQLTNRAALVIDIETMLLDVYPTQVKQYLEWIYCSCIFSMFVYKVNEARPSHQLAY